MQTHTKPAMNFSTQALTAGAHKTASSFSHRSRSQEAVLSSRDGGHDRAPSMRILEYDSTEDEGEKDVFKSVLLRYCRNHPFTAGR